MVSEAKARTQRMALASFVVAALTLLPLMMMAVPGLASEMIPEQIQALFLAGDSALIVAGAGLSLSSDERKRKTGTSLAGVGLASLGLKTSGCDFSQPPVEAVETPEEATPTSEQEAQPVIEPGTFSLQQEEGVTRLEGTRSDTGERLRLVALAPETDLEHTLENMEERFGGPFSYVTATDSQDRVVDLVGIKLGGEDPEQVAQRQAELASSFVAEGPMEILLPTIGSPDADGNRDTFLVSFSIPEGESLVVDEFGNYWGVKSEALADGGDLAGLRDRVEGRYEALCGDGFHQAVLEVFVRSDLEGLRDAQDIRPEMVSQDQERTVAVRLAKMVEEGILLLQAGELIAEGDWGQVEVVFDGDLGGLYIRPMSADLIGQVFGGFDELEEYFGNGIFSDADAETMRRAIQEELTEEASSEAFRNFYWQAVYNRGKNFDLFGEYETFEKYRSALGSAIENGDDLSGFSSSLPDGQEFNPLSPVEFRFTDRTSFLQARSSASGAVYEPDYDSEVNQWFLEVAEGMVKFVVDLTSGNRDASYFETGTKGGPITRSSHFTDALARVMATLQRADFPSSGHPLVQVDLMTEAQAISLRNQLQMQVELEGDRIVSWPLFWVGDGDDTYPPRVP